MEIFMVGGAVRDMLLGLPVQDRDWVVVGSTPEELVALGFLPVGKDFPVFLHPKTKEEYALARTERKTARGYRGFDVHAAPDVTLEQDLARRDLTINSIAACALIDWSTGRFGTDFDTDISALIDPYGGQRDIQHKVLRHVTDAFAEDPVRILRVARFAARFTDFSVAPETMALMQQMVADGEANALVAERVWQELSNGLMQAQPSRMMHVLQACGALHKLLPELAWSAGADAVIDRAANAHAPLPVRFACLVTSSLNNSDPQQLESDPNLDPNLFDPNLITNLIKELSGLCDRLRVPIECRELGILVWREHVQVARSAALDADSLVQLLQRCDAFRRPQRFTQVLLACECIDAAGQSNRLKRALAAAQTVATEKIAKEAHITGATAKNNGEMIAKAIHNARVRAVASLEAAGAA
jgi:tRNA nucleotidyltransferase (CCA-adding enzyme)